MTPSQQSSRRLPVLILLGLLFIIFPALALASASQPSPSAEAKLICHTSNPDECYPRLFHPTDEFQTVHDDQELPPGLHVRMNIWSGKREAKINVPDEVDPSLEGLPVDRAVVVVNPEQQQEEEVKPKIPKDAPSYENAGKIKEPKHESLSFYESLTALKSGADKTSAKEFDEALEGLEDISHDIYYGLKITEDAEAVKSLLCLMTGDHESSVEDATPRDQQAAAILAGALSNNPTALKELAKSWSKTMGSTCPGSKESLASAFYAHRLVPSEKLPTASERQTAASRAKAKVSAINGLIKDDAIRAEFLSEGGMSQILEILVPEDREWVTAQRKAGQLALDNFLDEDMGAKLGQWPLVARLGDKQCQGEGAGPQEGCWDYHVERIMEKSKDKDHWSRDLHKRLAKARKNNAKASGRSEL